MISSAVGPQGFLYVPPPLPYGSKFTDGCLFSLIRTLHCNYNGTTPLITVLLQFCHS